ncbi:type II/IV secretion system ATPase subunit [Candidatus Bathyarchaeota archaeon]|nr:type II/IV secretion system ATPase subunit [Candidatus Bathyarchaeota archaeon]
MFKELPKDALVLESYSVEHPFSRVVIAALTELGGGKAYFVEEVRLTDREREILRGLSDIIVREVEPPEDYVEPEVHLEREAGRLARKYGYARRIPKGSWPRILYYLRRDLLGFGPIHVVMRDRMIEDLSVNGVNVPAYVWHRSYESIPTNIIFTDEEALDNLIVKLTHFSGKHISTAFPILDAMLPNRDRLAATFKREVSPKGGSFTIRRFRERPFSIVELMELGTLDERLAAYFWMLIENRMTIAVIGGTGAGKTSTLNALASLVKPSMKIVTVEEIPELNFPHENWVQLVTRESYGLGTVKMGMVSLFDLVKASLRYRPDYIVVGEIRGEEAFVLFQALATGHGGLTTLHAESVEYAVRRLTSPPMNVAEVYIPLLNAVALVERVQLPGGGRTARFGRRIRAVTEVANHDRFIPIATWDPLTDRFKAEFKDSILLDRIAWRRGLSKEAILEEIDKRALFLHELRAREITENAEVARLITRYYIEFASEEVERILGKEAFKAEELLKGIMMEIEAEGADPPSGPAAKDDGRV